MSGSLYCLGKLALMYCASTCHTTGQNLATLGNKFFELCSVFIINVITFVNAELADSFTASGLEASVIHSQFMKPPLIFYLKGQISALAVIDFAERRIIREIGSIILLIGIAVI